MVILFFYNVVDMSHENDVAYFPGIFLGLPYNIVICGYTQSSREIAARLDYFYTRSRVVENYKRALKNMKNI
ncbi:MAG: hypothetical protein QXY24_00695 [Candidatus Aenigmatarchaeota archaeon]